MRNSLPLVSNSAFASVILLDARSDDVVHQINAATIQRIAIDRIPLSIYRRFGHAGVAAGKCRAKIIRARGAEIQQRQIVEIQTSHLIDGDLAVAAAVTGRDLAPERRRADDPLEREATIK